MEGSLFFHTRESWVLESALASGVPVSKENVISQCGMSSEEIKTIRGIVESLGGRVDRVSQLYDWMHVRFPQSLGDYKPSSAPPSCPFLRSSLSSGGDKRHKNIIKHLAASLHQAGMDQLASHLMLVANSATQTEAKHGNEEARASSSLPVKNKILQDKVMFGRHLSQAQVTENPNNEQHVYVNQTIRAWPLFVANESEAVNNLGAWYMGYAMMIQCPGKTESYLEGVGTPSCLQNYTVVLEPTSVGIAQVSSNTKTISFEDLGSYRRPCDEVPSVCQLFNGVTEIPANGSTYVYGFPLYKYAEPNMIYSATQLAIVRSSTSDVQTESYVLKSGIYNYQNATSITLREYYGVDPSLQGSNETVQASTLAPGLPDSAVNVTAVNEYLSMLGLDPHSNLFIPDFGIPNNVSVCDAGPTCGESMLDVQAMQSFAPNATTYFFPTRAGGNTKGQIREVLSFFDNLVAAEEMASVLSLSWSAEYPGSIVPALDSYLQKLASMGMTILVSSGDDGASEGYDGCNSGADGGPLIGNVLSNSWPNVSPWVTSVGGTQFLNVDGENMEVVCSSATYGGITSGGGFSGTSMNYSMPSWQQAAVARYFSENNASIFSGFPTANTPGWNPQGRGFPDISLYGAQYVLFDDPKLI